MNELVFIENGKAVTDSLTVADVFGKEHKNVIRDIENQIVKLIEAGEDEFSALNFERSIYTNDRGRMYEKFLLTEEAFTIIAFAYITPEAMKFKVKFIDAFKKMREQLNGPRALSEREQLIASMKLTIETSEKVDQIESEVIEVKNEVKEVKSMVQNQITLESGEQRRVQIAIASRIYELENNKTARPQLFSELHREIRNRFGVPTYKDIRKKDMQDALKYIEAWVPRRVS